MTSDAAQEPTTDEPSATAPSSDPGSPPQSSDEVVVDVPMDAPDGGDNDGGNNETSPADPASSSPASEDPAAKTTLPPLPRKTTTELIRSDDYRGMARRAAELAKLDRLGAGTKSVFKATMKDIGDLGIGLQLYFMLTKYLAVTFLCMGIIAVPTMILNKAGHGITSKMSDPLQLGYASLGNQGVNEDIASDPRQCLPRGNIDCNWTTVDTPFTTSPVKVAWIITISDCLYSLVFLLFCLVYRYRAKQAIDVYMNENLTPAKYAVMVRGLPRDATEAEILEHFNTRYDLTKDEEYFPLWFGCCWGRRRKVRHTRSRNAINRSTVQNLDHLAGTTSINKSLYLGTWIAEVSIGHPTGGLLRNFLSMEALTQSIAETRTLIDNLETEKKLSMATFRPRDEKLIHASKKKLDKLCDELERQKGKIKTLKQANRALEKAAAAAAKVKQLEANKKARAKAKVQAAAMAARSAAMATKQAFNWDACECAFVVFNNLESRRRCLQDYRHSAHWLARWFQPPELSFRKGRYQLIVTPAPEPSNILWENLEVTERGRFYRRSLTNFITFLLLLASAAIISGAQSAQQQFKDRMPPAGLCDASLPAVFYGNYTYKNVHPSIKWELAWDQSKTCTAGPDGKPRYYIAYTNHVVNALAIANPATPEDPQHPPYRCTDPCISETSATECSTMPCFDQDLQDAGKLCETYQASHTLYCLCTKALSTSIEDFGFVDGAKRLWNDVTPCRGFIKDYLQKNGLIVGAAAVVVIVNLLLNMILRAFATFERHSSESAKATAIALKMFLAQLLNTAVIVLLVNASLGLDGVPVLKELLKGKYRDFERDWYPTVGMGITTTMLINAFAPQLTLSLQMFLVAPLVRCLRRRSIRTQEQMNKLYAGPTFDISARYPMVLNSLVVTMVFCGGSPILLLIAAVTAGGTFWFDKLSIIHLYSVKTAYDEELGELALVVLPWTIIAHLAFSTWMYGNAKLMKATTIDLPWVLRAIGMRDLVRQYQNATPDELYAAFLDKAARVDILGKYGFVVKVVRANVMVIFLFLLGALGALLLSTVWVTLVYPMVGGLWRMLVRCCGRARKPLSAAELAFRQQQHQKRPSEGAQEPKPVQTKKARPPPPPPVILPEFTAVFRKSVKPGFRPDTLLGFERNAEGELVRKWQAAHTHHGLRRQPGELMRTWEAMQAPVKSYAIEMNDKYRLAVAEIVAAARALENKIVPVPGAESKAITAEVEAAITATEPINNSSSSSSHGKEKVVPNNVDGENQGDKPEKS